MSKFLKSCALAALFAASATPSHAVTIDDIMAYGGAGVASYRTYQYYMLQQICMSYSEGITFEKISDTQLKIKGLWEDELSFTFTLVNARGQATTDGSYLLHNYTELDESGNWRLCGFSSSGYFGKTPKNLQLTIQQGTNAIVIGTTTNQYLTFAWKGDDFNLNHEDRQFDGINIQVYKPNAIATDNFRTYNWWPSGNDIVIEERDRRDREYPMLVEFNGSDISLLNLGNNGFGIANRPYSQGASLSTYLFKIKASLNSDNSVAFPVNQVARPILSVGNVLDTISVDQLWQMAPAYLQGINIHDDGVIDSEAVPYLYGTYTPDVLAHNNAPHAWVSNDGWRKTYEDFLLSVNDFTYYFDGLLMDDINFRNAYCGTDIQGNNEVTLQLDLKITNKGQDDHVLGVAGEINTTANPQYVDHYELHVVPGLYSSINDLNFAHDLDLGHIDAVEIHESFKPLHSDIEPSTFVQNIHRPVISPSRSAARDAGDAEATLRANDYSFVKQIPWSHLGDSFKNANGVTYFVKAVYTPESNLTPTFHSLQAVSKDTATSIDDLTIDNTNAPVEYYNLQGIRVLNPTEGNIYIRRQGTSVEKITL